MAGCQQVRIANTINYQMQVEITLSPKPRGFHLITNEILGQISDLPEVGVFFLHIKHTSAGLTLNENADPSVLRDYERYFNKIAPENIPGMEHTIEGPDDMPAHIKASLVGNSISIPISEGRLNLGIWQGIYLCEFRNRGGARKVVVTVLCGK